MQLTKKQLMMEELSTQAQGQGHGAVPPPVHAHALVVGMNGGDAGELSYANNSDVQRTIASVTRKARQEMAVALYRARAATMHAHGGGGGAMVIADLGCATGPNALLMASDAVQAVVLADQHHRTTTTTPTDVEFHVFLNDLPTNDFNSVFRQLPQAAPLLAGRRCFVSAWPGSFYGRLFPAASLDYVVSSSSLHFLSKPPALSGATTNKGRMYVSPASMAATPVLDAYRAQFQSDFTLFLSCRAEEMRRGGVLLLTFVARRDALPSVHDCHIWDLLAAAITDMAAEGIVGADKLDAFDAPFYGPCPEELTQVIGDEGSFAIKRMDLFEVGHHCQGMQASTTTMASMAAETASTIRAVVEQMLGNHFGWDAMDDLFRRYSILLEEYYRGGSGGKLDQLTNVFLVLEKN